MKTRLFFLFLACFQMYNIYGQNPLCTPNLLYKDSVAGIYPRPYNDTTKTGGINTPACIGKDYEFPLTVRIPDTITVPFGNTTVRIALESAILDPTNAVMGLPKGIQYFCNPPNCTMAKNVLGCVVLKGKATAENTPGIFDLIINLKLVTAFGTLDVAFPGPFFPGKYFITVLGPNDPACTTSPVAEARNLDNRHVIFPNPAKDLLKIQFHAGKSGKASLHIQDIAGKSIKSIPLELSQGDNVINLPLEDLRNGIYIYTLAWGKAVYSKQFVVLK